jgi:hypothetical protein
MFRRFLDGADERLPCLTEAKTNLSVHVVGMELNLNGLPNDVVHVSGFNGEDGGFVEPNAVSQFNCMFSSLSSAPSRNLLNMMPDPQGCKVTIVGTRSPILTFSYWVNARSVALDLFPHP